MSKVLVVKIVPGKTKTAPATLQILDGLYAHDREATEALEESGDYLFLEVHSIEVAKKSKVKKETE